MELPKDLDRTYKVRIIYESHDVYNRIKTRILFLYFNTETLDEARLMAEAYMHSVNYAKWEIQAITMSDLYLPPRDDNALKQSLTF